MAHTQIISQSDTLGALIQRRFAYDLGAQLGHPPFIKMRKMFIHICADDQAQHRIA